MTINFNSSPYFDDYNKSKGFYKILFKPGFSVQARELTQLQTALQNQISQFGEHVFKEGSIVIPGGSYYEPRQEYFRVENTPTNLARFNVDRTGALVTAPSGVTAIVRTTKIEDSGIYVYVSYKDSATDFSRQTFIAGESVTLTKDGTVTFTTSVATTNAFGTGTYYAVNSGVIFVKGHFVYFDKQDIVVQTIGAAENASIGFNVVESTVSADEDGSLLDNSQGSSNFAAPGADRYKIDLVLTTRSVPNTLSNDNYVELLRVERSIIIFNNRDPVYNVLGDTLARRTFEESGNYTVRPYKLFLDEHLRNDKIISVDGQDVTVPGTKGFFGANDGGDESKYVVEISPGKAYVQGYEVENINSAIIAEQKARDTTQVNAELLRTNIGAYITVESPSGVLDFNSIPTVEFYSDYTALASSSSGTKVGSAKVRGYETEGNGRFRIYLFDLLMENGKTFDENAKQVYLNNPTAADYTANILPFAKDLRGTINITSGSANIIGVNTLFQTDLSVGDYIRHNSLTFKVTAITNNNQISVSPTPSTTIVGAQYSVLRSVVEGSSNALFVKFPQKAISRLLDENGNTEAIYSVRRTYTATVTGGAVTVSSPTGSEFASYSLENYFVVNSTTGAAISLLSSNFLVSGSNLTVTGLTNGTQVFLYTTIIKKNLPAKQKNKTLTNNSNNPFVISTQLAAQSTKVLLNKADGYKLISVKQSSSDFSQAYVSTNETVISDRYEFNNGQTSNYYGLSFLTLKPGQPKPTGPIKVEFQWFDHNQAGDYFSVDSYLNIDYSDIPVFVDNGEAIRLSDVLDFRPTIGENNTFSGIGSNIGQFVDTNSDFITDYSFYLPRIDKVYLTKDGIISIIRGKSDLFPVEPVEPQGSMPLYVLKLKPYVFDAKADIDVITIDNKRYTMRDIGKIENRVKNLEYYTSLSMLEKETASYQIKDEFGLDRFKNGFLVDQFKGHGIGNVLSDDYRVAVDFNNFELRARAALEFRNFFINSSNIAQLIQLGCYNDGVVTLPFTDVKYIEVNKASRTENVNPFSVFTWIGNVSLTPSSDIWFDTKQEPDLLINQEGNFNTLTADARARGLYETVWGAWQDFQFGSQRTLSTQQSGDYLVTTTETDVTERRTGTFKEVVERIDTTTLNDVELARDVIPKMRNIIIKFHATGMKPNTALHVFFDGIRVTSACVKDIEFINNEQYSAELLASFGTPLVTNEKGEFKGIFNYIASEYQLATGEKKFSLSDSPVNSPIERRTFAETTFRTAGTLITQRNEITSIRNGELVSRELSENRLTTRTNTTQTYNPPPPPPPPAPVSTYVSYYPPEPPPPAPQEVILSQDGIISTIIKTAFGRPGTAQEIDTASARIFNYYFETSENLSGGYRPLGPANGQRLLDDVASGDTGARRALENLVSDIAARNLGTANGTFTQDVQINGADPVFKSAIDATVNAVVANRSSVGSNDFSYSSFYNQNGVLCSRDSSQIGQFGNYVDPLAQSFLVERPMYLTKVDVFFATKDNNVPVRAHLRKMVNGTPGSDTVPGSEVSLNPADVNLSDNGSIATQFKFKYPIFVESGEYCLVLQSDSDRYNVFISQLGEVDIISRAAIDTQPYTGVLFKSQNASTWTGDQNQDLKFTLYRAEFSTTSLNVDINVNKNLGSTIFLEVNPLELTESSSKIRVYHKNHGFNVGNTVILNGVDNHVITKDVNGNITSGPISSFFGIPTASLLVKELVIESAEYDSYVIDVGVVPTNISGKIRFGGSNVIANNCISFSALQPAIAQLLPFGTNIIHQVRLNDKVQGIDSEFLEVDPTDITVFSSIKSVLDDLNENKLGGTDKQTFKYKVTLATVDPFLSPMIDDKQMGGLFIRNIINQSNLEDNQAFDYVTITNASNQVAFASDTITISGAQNIVRAESIIPGTYVTVSGAGAAGNNGTFRVKNVTTNGSSVFVKVAATLITAAAGGSVTVKNGTQFIDELAAVNGTSLAKYVTKKIDFANPSTSINVRIALNQPKNTKVRMFYKTETAGSGISLDSKEYVELPVDLRTTAINEFVDIERQVDNIEPFTSLVFKIVFESSDEAYTPRAKDLRIIALA